MVRSPADTHNIALSYVTPRCHHGLVIDVDRLMILREVARSGSKAAAARSLRLSEPTVAHHLAALERGAGVALTARAGRVTRLTPAGEALVEHADVIAASLESAERTLHHHADLQVGRLRIASFQSFCAAQLAAPLAQFARDYPGIRWASSRPRPTTPSRCSTPARPTSSSASPMTPPPCPKTSL
jgi:molybdate transport repressor ModE-like protein